MISGDNQALFNQIHMFSRKEVTDGITDRPTNGPRVESTDRVTYKIACTRLKSINHLNPFGVLVFFPRESANVRRDDKDGYQRRRGTPKMKESCLFCGACFADSLRGCDVRGCAAGRIKGRELTLASFRENQGAPQLCSKNSYPY